MECREPRAFRASLSHCRFASDSPMGMSMRMSEASPHLAQRASIVQKTSAFGHFDLFAAHSQFRCHYGAKFSCFYGML